MDSSSKSKVPGAHDLPTPEPESPSLPHSRRPYAFSTLCATVENPNSSHKDQHGSSSVPIYQTATFKGVGGDYDYSRSGNPTRTHLGERSMCSFERQSSKDCDGESACYPYSCGFGILPHMRTLEPYLMSNIFSSHVLLWRLTT